MNQFFGERHFEEVETTNMRMSLRVQKFGLFLSEGPNDVTRLDIIVTCMDSMWKILQKGIVFEDPTPLKDQVHLRCTQREGKAGPQVVQSKN